MISTDRNRSRQGDLETALASSYVNDDFLGPIIAELLLTRQRYLRQRVAMSGEAGRIAVKQVLNVVSIALTINNVVTKELSKSIATPSRVSSVPIEGNTS